MSLSHRQFDEAKTTQAAALFLSLGGGRMNLMKLVKLLYLMDREALLRWGRPISFDKYFSLDFGPILQNTLDRINHSHSLPANIHSPWRDTISDRSGHDVSLLGEYSSDCLSDADENLIHDIHKKYGHLDQWDLSKLTHRLPEWSDPEGSRNPIHIRDILLGEGFDEDEAREIEEAVDAESQFVARFAVR